MAKSERVERSFDELIGTDREFAADIQAIENASAEAARFVKGMREHASLTQKELAQRLGISQPRVSAMEKGAGPEGPTYGMLKRIARACGVSWSLEAGLQANRPEATAGVMHQRPTIDPLAAGAFGFLAGAIGMALLRSKPSSGQAEEAYGRHEAEGYFGERARAEGAGYGAGQRSGVTGTNETASQRRGEAKAETKSAMS